VTQPDDTTVAVGSRRSIDGRPPPRRRSSAALGGDGGAGAMELTPEVQSPGAIEPQATIVAAALARQMVRRVRRVPGVRRDRP
jgi:hypothetical protein